MKINIGKKNFFIPNILIVLLMGFFVRVIFSRFGTLKLDLNTFIAWSNSLVESGFKNFYKGWSDYLPGYLYILWLLGKIRQVVYIPNLLLFKFPAMVADLVTGYLIFKIVSKLKNKKTGIILSSLYIFNPAILANSTLWGQADSLVALFSILTLYFLTSKPLLSAFFLSIGTLVKPQAAFLSPVVLSLFLDKKVKYKKIITYILFAAVIFLITFYPFFPREGNFINFIFQRLSATSGQYPFTSVNAFNFWGIFALWKSDLRPFPFFIVGILAFLATNTFVYLKTKKKTDHKYFLGAAVLFSSYIFLTRMHERHLLPALPLLLISASELPNLLYLYFFLSFSYVLNLYYSFVWITKEFKQVFPEYLIKLLSFLNTGTLFLLLKEGKKKTGDYLTFLRKCLKKSLSERKNSVFPQIKIEERWYKIFLILILIFSLFSRLLWLGSPKEEYFDEVYHAFTAKEMLHGNKAAWEWWNTPPEGFAYEWTHPPLAKLFMWGSMKLFQESSFFWRLPGALLGVGCVFLVYLIAKIIFKDKFLGLISAFLFGLDGLVLSMSRIGMNDIYLLFFSLGAIYFFLKDKNHFSAVSLALALSSKWSALWVLPILFVIWLTKKKKFKFSYFWFLIVPFIYLATYIPMFTSGHDLGTFWGMQKQMWWYHTGLEATHPYTSPWWSWPFLVRPVYLFTTNEINGMVSRIYNLGNPVIFWFGLVSVLVATIYSFVEKNKKLALVVFSYLVFFVPWAASPRIMFFYHYLPSLPFLTITMGFVLRKEKKFIIPVFFLAFLTFLYFYPHWTGVKIPLWWDKSYYWFDSWR